MSGVVDHEPRGKGVVESEHVRMLGLCLVSALAVAAIAAVPALAKKETNEFAKFNECPFGYPPVEEGFVEVNVIGSGCIYGEAGKESFFQAGKVTVKFAKPVILRGGFEENEATGGTTLHRRAQWQHDL